MLKNCLIFCFIILIPFLNGCNDGSDQPEPKVYAPNKTIFNTFLYAEGSWWAFEDSLGNQDTFYIKEDYSQKRNVFEGSKHVYSDYKYSGTLIRTKENKQFLLLYTSSNVHEYQGATRTFILISSFQNSHGIGDEKLFYTPWPINDSVLVGSRPGQIKNTSFLTILETGDSTLIQGSYHLGKYYKYRISSSLTNNLNDVQYLWQENLGLVEYNLDGSKYHLTNYNVIKPTY